VYSGNYARAADLGGETVRVRIKDVKLEEIGREREEKLVLYFTGAMKPLALNVTNSRMIEAVYGDETDDWKGKVIELYPARVDFQGKTVDAIRVSVPVTPAPAKAPARTPEPDPDDDIPW
jgi:hypothetical protein